MKDRLRKLCSRSLLMIPIMAYSLIVYGAIQVSINFEHAWVDEDWKLTDGEATFHLNKFKDQWTHFTEKPVISSSDQSVVGKSLKFRINGTTDHSYSSQRTEYIMKRSIAFDQWRYVGFQFALGNNSQPPVSWTVLTQFHQLPQPFTASPMAALLLDVGMAFQLSFKIRNTSYYYVERKNGPGGNALEVWNKSIGKNRWYDIIIGFRPDGSEGNNKGRVKIWFDGDLELDWSGDLGMPDSFLGETWMQQYDLKTGIYRATQNSSLSFHIDNYRLGSSYDEVML
ncbi:hypothetical protein FNH22_08905 [Fulvivirga sp. M361]|uniref:heparin lyase I family protein n=1 Tax=Fulvivirga sp. M361 TaxID=2594266 RepID=UPI00117B2092|nr:heparin lyase I family protein [Fulvivirga sp. M361]TRX60158.1 hypothetical protein FNH22_08905 [Fulvivirga sp. M361]